MHGLHINRIKTCSSKESNHIVLVPPLVTLTKREQEVMNWATEEIDANIKLGDKLAEVLRYIEDTINNNQPQ